jgi:hypothetical protein
MHYPSPSLPNSLLSLPIYINMKMHNIIFGFRINTMNCWELYGNIMGEKNKGDGRWEGRGEGLACS